MANIYLSLDGIEGESQGNHDGDIDVKGWTWGMLPPGPAPSSAERPTEGTVTDITVHKLVDKSSPAMMNYCLSGREIPHAKLTVTRGGRDEEIDYFTMDFEGLTVTSLALTDAEADKRITEDVKLHFRGVRVTYNAVRPDGSIDSPVDFDWHTPR